MKKKILILLTGVFFTALMVLNFNQAQKENTSSITVDFLNAAQAQSESCPCEWNNCACKYKTVDCPNGGSGCKTSGNECSSYRSC
jgi:hypothetical protein